MRKARAKKRIQTPDPRFNDVLISRFINCMMEDGKKSQARKIFYDAIDIIYINDNHPDRICPSGLSKKEFY